MKRENWIGVFGCAYLTLFAAHGVDAATYSVTSTADDFTAGTLRSAMSTIVQSDTDPVITVNFDPSLNITLTNSLPIVAANAGATGTAITFNGNGSTINGAGSFQAFFVTPVYNYAAGASTITANFNDLTVTNCKSAGGNGGGNGNGGGGGMGAGGALFVDANATVVVANSTFSSCNATGGNGGNGSNITVASGSGGGGGYGGNGGSGGSSNNSGSGGGGGFRSAGGSGSSGGGGGGGGGGQWIPGLSVTPGGGAPGSTGGGGGGTLTGGAAGGASGGNGGTNLASAAGGTGGAGDGAAGVNGGTGGAGGGSGAVSSGGAGAFGGGGGGGGQLGVTSAAKIGGAGGKFGGGGGSALGCSNGGGAGGDFGGSGGAGGFSGTGGAGASGGYGGGGGGGSSLSSRSGAGGGFGGGGGGKSGVGGTEGGNGGTAGGVGVGGGGGGGAGLGGAVFVRTGGTLTINNGSFSSNTVTAGTQGSSGGTAGTSGQAKGGDLYTQSSTSSNISFLGSTSFGSSLALPAGNAFNKNGTGTLTLTQPSSYNGNTLLNAGTLAVTADAQLGTGTAVVFNAAGPGPILRAGSFSTSKNITLNDSSQINVTAGSTFTVNGVFDGAAASNSFQLNDGTNTGTLTLTQPATTYTGGTTISSGTLALTSTAALNSTGAVTIAGPGVFDISGITPATSTQVGDASGAGSINLGSKNLAFGTASATKTLSGTIADGGISGGTGGSITKVGSGVVILSGANSYTGGSTISAGTLKIQNNGNLGTGAVTLDGGTLGNSADISPALSNNIFINSTNGTISTDAATTFSYSGTIADGSGSGQLFKTGTGTLVLLTAPNSYSGGTTVSVGTLQGDTTSLQGAIDVSGGATLAFSQSSTGTYSGTLTGTGNLTKAGTGKVTLNGTTNGFTGPTNITAGELNVQSTLPSAVAIGISGILSGSGTVGAVTSSGTIKPGNSIGTLNVASLTLNPSAITEIELAPLGISDLIAVAGAAALDGTLQIVATPGTYAQTQTYTILTAGSVTGTFSSITLNNPSFQATLVYSPTMVQIMLAAMGSLFHDVTFSGSNTQSVADNINALNASGSLAADPDLNSIVNSLTGQSNAVVNDALSQMQPAQYSALEEMQTEIGAEIVSIFHNRPYRKCSEFKPYDIWIEPFGNWFEEDSLNQQVGFNARVGGVAAGFDAEVLHNWVVGIGGAYDHSSLSWKEHRGHARANSYYGAVYTDYKTSKAYVGATILAGRDNFHVTRKIDFLTTDRRANSHFHGTDIVGQLSGALFWGRKHFTASPFVNLDYLYLHENKFREKNAGGLNLNVSSYTSKTFRSETGMSFRYKFENETKARCITPLISLAWIADVPLHREKYTATFVNQTLPFKVKGWDHAWNLFAPSAGLTFSLPHFAFTMQYTAEIGSHFLAQKGNARLDYTW